MCFLNKFKPSYRQIQVLLAIHMVALIITAPGLLLATTASNSTAPQVCFARSLHLVTLVAAHKCHHAAPVECNTMWGTSRTKSGHRE